MPVAAVPEPDNFITVRASYFNGFIDGFFTAHYQLLTVGTTYFLRSYFHY